jgi:hypothetical protein
MMTSLYGLLAFLHWNHDWNNWHFPEDSIKKAALQIRELGVDTVRTDLVWSDVYAGPDRYNFSRYDRLFAQLHEHGLNLLVLLHYNKIRLDAQGREIWNRPPDSFEEFARYVETTVRRYKRNVHAWEIWNEPNHSVYWNAPIDELRPYCRLLKLSYDAAKNVDPSCLVINGGITGDVAKDVAAFYANGGGQTTDKLNIHTFLNPIEDGALQTFDSIVADVERVMKRSCDGEKKIWITEMGCPGVADTSVVKPWWIGRNTTEYEQADWLAKIFKNARRHASIEKLFWAFYRDTSDVFHDGVDYFGLVRSDFTPKPAFERLKSLSRG